MRREWTIWLGFIAVVFAAVVFVVTRDNQDSSKLSAGTSVPTTVRAPLTTVTTKSTGPTTPTSSPSTTVTPSTAPATTRSTTPATAATTPATTPRTVVTAPPPTAPPPTAPPPTDPPLKASFGPGTYRINIDLPPGTYRTEGGPYCTWARLSSVTQNPTPADVIASGYSTGAPITVAIPASDAAFTTSDCDLWLQL
ncbi:MAG: hypothetical protein QOG43_1046 [Actinomycetota bacterium]|jgi:hypothetical protein|nr:hypothetical protein [Actinomycetota bacterium]